MFRTLSSFLFWPQANTPFVTLLGRARGRQENFQKVIWDLLKVLWV